jgi:hypothetical protein
MPKAAQNVLFPKEQNSNIAVTLAESMLNPYDQQSQKPYSDNLAVHTCTS